MRNFQDTFETRKRSFISNVSICVTIPLIREVKFRDDHLPNNCSLTRFNLKKNQLRTINLKINVFYQKTVMYLAILNGK